MSSENDTFDILIVDDNNDNLLILNRIFGKKYKCCSVNNGFDAVEACEKMTITLVIMDIRMPGMTGLEASEKIKEKDDGIVIVAFSSEVKQRYERSPGCYYPFDEFVQKPILFHDISEVVDQYLGGKTLCK